MRIEGLSIKWQVTIEHLCCWGFRITKACLAGALKIINTAKLLQLIRITNADGRYFVAPIAQMQCCAPLFLSTHIVAVAKDTFLARKRQFFDDENTILKFHNISF
jgi:hypothetical protein